MQELSLVVSAVCRALFISNISSFCRVLSPNWLYFNKILVCLPLFLNGLPCWESKGSSLLRSLPSLSHGDLSLPKLQADWDLRHSEKWENNSLTVPIPFFASSLRLAWLSALAAGTQALSCCTAELGCPGPSLQHATGNFVPVLVWRDTCFYTLIQAHAREIRLLKNCLP